MLAKELASNNIPAIESSAKISEAISLLHEYNISQIPVVETDSLLGLFSQNSITTNDKTLANQKLFNFAVNQNDNCLTILEQSKNHNFTIYPVIDNEQKYIGNFSSQDLLKYFANMISANFPTGTIILEMPFKDYSLNEISQFVEINGAKILNVYSQYTGINDIFEITIKINTYEITPILEALFNHNYNVKSYIGNYNQIEDLYRSRIDDLFKYMNV